MALLRRERPDGRVRWLARFMDPDTKATTHETVPARFTTEEQRTSWAAKRARELARRSDDVAGGAPTKKNVTLETAIEGYFSGAGAGLREKTRKGYRAATNALTAWARGEKVVLGDELRGEHLAALRVHLMNKPLRAPSAGKGKGRGKREETARKRAARSVNRELRAIKTVLEHLRRLGLVPFVTRDAIADNLELLAEPRPVPAFLRTSALTKLIEAASRHDSEKFELTRDEKARGLTKGETPRFPPILPYLVTVLLTGMRADEARLLKWRAVDFGAEPAGVIELRPEDVKTKHGRLVDLAVSGVLRELLAALHLRTGGKGYVFGGAEAVTYASLEAARKRLVGENGAPGFSWQRLRVTSGTFLANAPGIYGGASAYREAKQLGHSVTVAEKHYLGVVHVKPEAKTLEAAMGIEVVVREALGLVAEAERASASEGA